MEEAGDAELRACIQSIMRSIREATPGPESPNWMRAADVRMRDDRLGGKRVGAASVTLFPSGCRHASHGGCTMCGEWSGSNLGKPVSPMFHVAQFAASSVALLSEAEDLRWLRIYNEGSFLNDLEMAPSAREVILQLASRFNCVKRVTIETRPEQLTSDKAAAVRSWVAEEVELEIGIGLEAKDDFVRNICIGKDTPLKVYPHAVEIAHKHDMIALAYVLLKPPFLNEHEALEEAISTVMYAFEVGFDEVYIQPASIQGWSLSEMLLLEGVYSPPWLWSVIEVVKRTWHAGTLKIGGLEYFPRPNTIARNWRSCQRRTACQCNDALWDAIAEYNATHDVSFLMGEACACRRAWRSELVSAEEPLRTRMRRILNAVSVEDYVRYKLDAVEEDGGCVE